MELGANGSNTSQASRVFISYASKDIDQAVKVEAYLRRHQVETFRDRRDVRTGDNWDLEIEKHLQSSDRMVLLVSANSMPYRKEVHREWFFFDQLGKRIYPLLLDPNCHRHSRLYSYNHIDATRDFQGALDILLGELRRDEYAAPEPRTLADQVTVLEKADLESRSLDEALDAIYQAVTDPSRDVVLSVDEAKRVRDYPAVDERGYRLRTIAEWSLPRYQIFSRFVNLTLLLDKGPDAPERWRPEDLRFSDLREVLKKTAEHQAIVLLGAPGSGKSTLLRRLQLDHSIDQLRDDGHEYSIFLQLNSYQAQRGQSLPLPGDWLAEKWQEKYPHRPSLKECLQKGRVLLLLDALNEMPHRDTNDYFELIGLWRDFTRDVVEKGNRIVYSCRSLDYSARLSSKGLPVPQVAIQPMTDDQVRAFLKAYLPANHAAIWAQLDKTPQLDLYRNPYFLTLLVAQVVHTGQIPAGRSALFTAYVRGTLSREIETGGEIFGLGLLLDHDDHERSTNNQWRSPFDLPHSGSPLFERLSALAFDMQRKGVESESSQIRISRQDAARLIDHDRANEMITAALRMSILDQDKNQEEDLAFYHQLLQEYFAGRRLAQQPDATLVHVEHEVGRVAEPLEVTVARIAAGDPLPTLPQTGWEETTHTAAAMARDPVGFIRELIPHNLPLAARCATSREIRESPDLERLRDEIRQKLLERTRSSQVDLRARIAAGEALGLIGDPRFPKQSGRHGEYIAPPLVGIPAGRYPIGDNRGAHEVELVAYRIGAFPVTNAEYRCFI
ncbi:MAG: TIR domain-containing protein, partial [Blastocatellia bacterium]